MVQIVGQINVVIPADLLELCCSRMHRELVRMNCAREGSQVYFDMKKIAPQLYNSMMSALASAPLSKIKIIAPEVATYGTSDNWDDRTKNRYALDRIGAALGESFDPRKMVKGIATGERPYLYKGSFFGDGSPYEGCLFHLFMIADENGNLGKNTRQAGIQVKFISPTNEKEERALLRKVQPGVDPVTKQQLTFHGEPVLAPTMSQIGMRADSDWRVVSFHDVSDNAMFDKEKAEFRRLHPDKAKEMDQQRKARGQNRTFNHGPKGPRGPRGSR